MKFVNEHGRNAHSSWMLKQLGVKKLPSEGMPIRMVQDIMVWVEPFVPAFRSGVRVKSSTHRVRCYCPECGKKMSAGRLHQHICKPTTKDTLSGLQK
jgi:hypothetical protein